MQLNVANLEVQERLFAVADLARIAALLKASGCFSDAEVAGMDYLVRSLVWASVTPKEIERSLHRYLISLAGRDPPRNET